MAYIGKIPTAAALTASDITDGIISNAKLAQDIISADTALGAEPADTDEFLVSDAGVLKRMDYSYIKGGGITEADMWRITSSLSASSAVITANWERADAYGFDKLGTGMSESSGIFTFPSTGHWLVSFNGSYEGANIQYAGMMIMVTTDNSSYNQYAKQYTSLTDASDNIFVHLEALIDVTNTTNVKVKFEQQMAASSGSWGGSTNVQRTGATFIKLADT